MRIYRTFIRITGIITVLSFILAVLLSFTTNTDSFWINTLIGIFASSLIVFSTSIIGYRVERRKTFEDFFYYTNVILHDLDKYQDSWGLEEKINYFLAYCDIDIINWDRVFGEFAFLFDFKKRKTRYLYSKIYKPLLEVNQLVKYHTDHFRWYMDGTGRNEVVITTFIHDIENLLPAKNKDKMNIKDELNGKFFLLMNGRRLTKKLKSKRNE